MFPCKREAGPFAESASDVLLFEAGNSLPEAFKCAPSRWFCSWIWYIEVLLHVGAVLPGLKDGEGDVGKISVAEDWVILYIR